MHSAPALHVSELVKQRARRFINNEAWRTCAGLFIVGMAYRCHMNFARNLIFIVSVQTIIQKLNFKSTYLIWIVYMCGRAYSQAGWSQRRAYPAPNPRHWPFLYFRSLIHQFPPHVFIPFHVCDTFYRHISIFSELVVPVRARPQAADRGPTSIMHVSCYHQRIVKSISKIYTYLFSYWYVVKIFYCSFTSLYF